MKFNDLQEDGRIVKGVNTTADVGPNQTSIEANKLVGKVNKDGYPPELHSKARKNSKPNTLYNLGLAEQFLADIKYKKTKPVQYTQMERACIEGGHEIPENISKTGSKLRRAEYKKQLRLGDPDWPDLIDDASKQENISHTGTDTARKARKKKLKAGDEEWFKHWFSLPHFMKESTNESMFLKLVRTDDQDILQLRKKGETSWVEVRGKPNYEIAHDRSDRLHQLLDKLDPATVSKLMDGSEVYLNPKNSRTAPSIAIAHNILANEHIVMENPLLYGIVRALATKGVKVGKNVIQGWLRHAPPGVTPDQAADAIVKLGAVTGGAGAAKANKTTNEKWSNKYKKSINCSNPKGFSQKAHCAGRKKNEDVTPAELNALERVVDKAFSQVGIDVEFTRHFLDRANDSRNGEPITVQELARLFSKEIRRWGKPIAQMGPDTEAVMKDLESDINIPFALRWNGKELEMIAKTVMRKKDFRTSNKEFPVENLEEWVCGECYAEPCRCTNENFADGKKKGKSRPGRVKRSGASCKGSVTSLRAKAKKYSGERGKMYHWCANMKSGKKKK